MAQLHIAVSILVVAVTLDSTFGQMVMVPSAMMMRPPNHPMHLLRPVPMAERAESLDEDTLQQRLQEVAAARQTLRDKQMELDEKLGVLHEEAVNIEKQIAEDQQQIHKLEELERLHVVEQVRLERLLEQHRVAQYQEKVNQERLAQQRAIEEMNRAEARRRAEGRKEADVNDEIKTKGAYEGHAPEVEVESPHGAHYRREDERPHNESGKDPRGISAERVRKNEQPHSTGELLPPHSRAEQETLSALQPNMPLTRKHVIEKKEVHEDPGSPTKTTDKTLANEPKLEPQALKNGTKPNL